MSMQKPVLIQYTTKQLQLHKYEATNIATNLQSIAVRMPQNSRDLSATRYILSKVAVFFYEIVFLGFSL